MYTSHWYPRFLSPKCLPRSERSGLHVSSLMATWMYIFISRHADFYLISAMWYDASSHAGYVQGQSIHRVPTRSLNSQPEHIYPWLKAPQ